MRKNEKEQKRTMQGKSIMMGISTLALLISNSMVAFASPISDKVVGFLIK